MLAPAYSSETTHDRNEAAHSGSAAYTFELVTSRAAFDALEADWNDLFARAGHGIQVFQTFNWNWHWCNHYLDGNAHADASTPAIVTARSAGRLVLVLPLVMTRTAGLAQLTWLGEPVSQYGDALVEDGPDTRALLTDAWRFVTIELSPDLAHLRKVRDDAAVTTLLEDLPTLTTQRLAAPYLDYSDSADFEAYQQRYSPRSRRNRRRLARRFAERGEMAVERHLEGARARDLAVEAIDLKRVWLKDRGLVSPAMSDPRMPDFFADVAEGATHPTGCQVSTLTSDGTSAATEITLRCKDRTVMHIIVFNLAYEKAGAGILLLEETIANAFGNGCRAFDLLAPADSYKLDWADASTGVADYAVPLSWKGWIYARLYLGLARQGIKRALAAMPLGLRRRIAG